MDRIARAIELAREDAAPEAQTLRLREPGRPVPASQVRYSETRAISVSADALRARHVTGGQERTVVAEAFKRLRTQILQKMRESGRNVLGIASPRAGEGKTTVALNLAVHTSMEPDWTVLLVEADLGRPAMCAALGVEPLPGVSDWLEHEAPLEKLLVNPGFGRCILLPAGCATHRPSELLGSARMQQLAAELKQRYPDRLVIFDLPPLLDSADGIAALPWVEALLLVVEEGRTGAEDVLRAAQLAGPERLLGTVLNKSLQPAVQATGRGWLARLLGGGA
jgi:protein-tyrosine kinase